MVTETISDDNEVNKESINTAVSAAQNLQDEVEQRKVVTVARDDVLDSAFAQYKESDGHSYPLTLAEEGGMLHLAPDYDIENYYDSNAVSAYDVAKIDFVPEASSMHDYTRFELRNEVRIDGETYEVREAF